MVGWMCPRMKVWCHYGGESRSIWHILKSRKGCTWKIAWVICTWNSLPVAPSVLLAQSFAFRNLPRNIQRVCLYSRWRLLKKLSSCLVGCLRFQNICSLFLSRIRTESPKRLQKKIWNVSFCCYQIKCKRTKILSFQRRNAGCLMMTILMTFKNTL